jgi:argininosuccinate synthase
MQNLLVQLLHRSTGAGNDQIRFDLIFQTIAPEIEITPIRDLKLSRRSGLFVQNEVHYSWEKHNIQSTRALGQVLEVRELDSSNRFMEAYPSQLQRRKRK